MELLPVESLKSAQTVHRTVEKRHIGNVLQFNAQALI